MVMSSRFKKIIVGLLILITIFTFMQVTVYAKDDKAKATATPKEIEDAKEQAETDIGNIAGLIAAIFQKIGIMVIFIGGLQVAWAMSSDNPEMKGQALKLIAAGILVTVMSTAYPLIAGS